MSNFSIPHDLTAKEAVGMTVNERLFIAGLMRDYDAAVEKKDIKALSEILKKVYLNQDNIDAIITCEFGKE